MKLLKKYSKIIYGLIAFFLPLLFITIILALKGVWLFGDTTILASDGFHQYVIFHETLRNVLHGDGSIFYTFTSGSGLNFYALMSYYLGSFLLPLLFFADMKSMPDFLYLFTIIKFGLTGLSTYISLKEIHKKLHPIVTLFLSTSLSLMSFMTSQLEISSWLDVFILLPLILLGLHKIVIEKGRILYFVTLTCLFIQNYYFGYIAVIFLSFWFLLKLSWDFKKRWQTIIDFTIVSTLAALTSLVMLLPTILDLRTHGEKFTEIVKWQTDNSWILDFFAKNMVGAYDTTKFGALPMIFVGLLPLILSLLFFTIKSIKWQVKCTYAFFIIFLIASFYLQPLDLFWQGMHAPNMFLHRYAWVFSFLIIYMAAEVLIRIRCVKPWAVFTSMAFLTIGYVLTYLFKEHYTFLENISFILTAEFLLVYLILLLIVIKKRISYIVFSSLILFFGLFEMGIHSQYQIEGLAEEWNFPSRSSYLYQADDMLKLVETTQNDADQFYRTERLLPQTGNDSMKYNYNGISQFSSIRNRSSSSTLDKLGFRSDGTNLNLRYQNNTLIGDSLLGIRYNLSATNPLKFGFTEIDKTNTLSLYENQFASSLGILTNSVYQDVKFTNLTLDNQTNFLNALSANEFKYYTSLHPISIENVNQLDNRVTVKAKEGEDTARATYTFTVPANSQLYISLPNLSFTNEHDKGVNVTVNNVSNEFTTDNSFSIFSAGYFSSEKIVTIDLTFPQNQQVSFDTPQFYRLDLIAYQAAMASILEKDITTTVDGNQVTTTYNSQNKASIFYTIPYDKGWSATLNGKKIGLKKAQNGFTKVDVPKGKGILVLTFIPSGFRIGLASFFIGIGSFIGYDSYRKKTTSKKSKDCNK
ncbi:copper ABC transporter permease [Streptococcus sp. X16XC17]|uniref:YfhO family protein n=1 Tax=unclassified Streptococcus TaxID=2608887 RepID=UPI00066FE824|nr:MULTISPECIES: YfhO family protein [unclassified Streptococcus]TCD45478.1 copper ABC transporter permease [Streptococcus sp. X16XC17]